ncbi:MAG: mechanosensitive ion channel family protein [Dehalococcoidia bacterium]
MIPLLASDWDKIEDWLKANGTDILIIVGVALGVQFAWKSLFPHLARAAMMSGAHPPDAEMERRADSIIGVVNYAFTLFLVTVASVMILTEFGVDVTALIAGLGIAGLALAMGSQQFVRDAINGIFLLAEDQYRTGDVVTIADTTGTVEAITLRRTVLRDNDGVVHSVPNGSITVVSNHTRDYAVVNVQIRIGLGDDVNKVKDLIAETARQVLAEPALAQVITEGPSVLGVTAVDDLAVTITVTTRTLAGARWEVGRDLRQRFAESLAREGIRVPLPPMDAGGPAGPAPNPDQTNPLL